MDITLFMSHVISRCMSHTIYVMSVRSSHIGQLPKVYYVNAEAIMNDVTQERVDDYVAALNGKANMEHVNATAEASGISRLQYYNDWYLMLHKVVVDDDGTIKCDCKAWAHDGGHCMHKYFVMHMRGLVDLKVKCGEVPHRTKAGRKRKTLLALFRQSINSPAKKKARRGKKK